ncbi:Bax inhibitor-1 family protein [Weissella koreensis]|uniref:Bax inhibitor-1/YccA family protein n=1 Tax=Weissella koreensis TaxID=165096 RepID=A0A7H1MNE8_9LACO|nr:Bax inhibitor-1/YccA family protein [Weissella koreensis]AVH75782.1 BAX inhibitor (BI)-1/YccA family protein [Weissella koreensis]QGN21003.1 BAX inhibitor (BI)-1/YccA family protein [Weissella koreensis]QNT64984.1 Bax inhibitor-1/YccA family protein [Weissella koreensis]
MDNLRSKGPRLVNPGTSGLNSFFLKVYSYMGMALLVTAATVFIGVTMFAQQILALTTGIVPTLVLFAILFGISWVAARSAMDNPARSFGLLMAYSVIMGLFFTSILLYMTPQTIILAFITTAALFMGMALYGATTKRDMSKMGTIVFGAVFALIIGGLLNIFIGGTVLYMLISWAGVVIFAIITAYDMNRLKQMYVQIAGNHQAEQGVAVYGALSLYLDFINLFLYILRIFGMSSNNN